MRVCGIVLAGFQSRLRKEGYHYRHTDNINLWRRACLSVRIKEVSGLGACKAGQGFVEVP